MFEEIGGIDLELRELIPEKVMPNLFRHPICLVNKGQVTRCLAINLLATFKRATCMMGC